MFELAGSLIAVCCALLLSVAAANSVGVMQQCGYKNGGYWRWLRRKDNLFYNRLSVLALMLALATTVVSLCFSFLDYAWSLGLAAATYALLCLLFILASKKYALKVKTKRTGRAVRLFVLFCLLNIALAVGAFWGLWALAKWNGSEIYSLIAYAPLALLPICLPSTLIIANAITGVFENARNRKFVKRAGQVLDETEIIRVGIVGSYGKTSVKNVLKTILSEKYSVVETPESYNTPMGIAKTVFSSEFANKQVFIAEMGARRKGDISELCALVKPDYAIFTGVCEQHIATFESLDAVWLEKSEILKNTAKKTVCGKSLRARIENGAFDEEKITYACVAENISFGATETEFILNMDGESARAKTRLLGNAAVENIALAATLAKELGLNAEEIARGISKLQSIPHRLELIEQNGVYILDDGYNCNPIGAREALAALCRFGGGKCIVTPGIVECGVLEEKINEALGEDIAKAGLDKVLLVGDTLVGAVKRGYVAAGGDEAKLTVVKTLDLAQAELSKWLKAGDCVLFMNDLPDVYLP